MALFSRSKKVESADSKPVVAKDKVKQTGAVGRNLSDVIVGPRLTEKTVAQGDRNVYTFTIARSATKFLVRDAVKALYGVTPVKVNIVNKLPAKRLSGSKNRLVHEAGYKKAYVYLKKGDTINLV
jgi:large subunit ribosomal protein L23